MIQKTYTIKTISYFSAAHIIPGHPGICARLHGHNFKVEVEMIATKLNEIGISIDFQDVKTATKALIDQLDHRYLNEIPPFDHISPTAENLAQWIYQQLLPQFESSDATLNAITVWESENNAVRYTEGNHAQ
ncbi:MAG TPA: 6-carboxytetrahydropterin synthase QueD [Gammaproteobacteria bacterium]|nr:6-carboxytetrahydropterin synthase QueD [Gammaproteobacteria bacterium]